jgi:bacillithiol system protein YtxJ
VDDAILPLHDETELDEVLRAPRVVIYKHSLRCGICSMALIEVQQFARAHRDVPVYMLDVLAQRSLSRRVASRLDVRHASPQVIVVRDGKPVWHGSHFRVSADALQTAVGEPQ